jgi:MFS family permease
MQLAYWNGALFAIGKGLASTPLVIYLSMELAERFAIRNAAWGIGLILAAPQLVGVLRLGAPALIGRLARRKEFCVAAYLGSGLMLLALPMTIAPGCLPSSDAVLAVLAGVWCAYNLLEFLGEVALWSWLADLAPLAVRGRFLGRRERWMAAGQAAAMLSSGLFVWGCHESCRWLPGWTPYAIAVALGAGMLIAAIVPLLGMPAATGATVGPRNRALRTAEPTGSGSDAGKLDLSPFADRRFRRLLVLGCWLALCTGLTEAPQNAFPKWGLGIGLLTMLALKVGLRLGQWTISTQVGRWTDRLGNRPVLACSLLLVAQGPVFYFLSTPAQPWWLAGAWLVWIAWVGVNIGIPNLLLKLAPPRANLSYIATYFAVTGLCVGLSTIAGGRLFDCYRYWTWIFLGWELNYYQIAFLLGWITRSLGVLLLLWVSEDRQGPVTQ